MLDSSKPRTFDTAPPNGFLLRNGATERRAQSIGWWSLCRVSQAGQQKLAALLCLVVLAGATLSIAATNTTTGKVLLPVEVMGASGTTETRTVTLPSEQARSVRTLWLQVHGLQYALQASVQVNASAWIPLNNNTVTIAEPGRSFGGIGGGFATLVMTVALPESTVISGTNKIQFRFNQTDGFASGYRVLAWNFLTGEGRKILPPEDFEEDAPDTWTPPLPDAAAIQAGRELWENASLATNSLPNSTRMQAHCADCHAQDGRDLKYFNFSNGSIVARSRFHGLSTLQGEQIASYIRSLPFPDPGRPWNPPYQPGPGLDQQPVANWAAGAGLAWVLEQDTRALPYLLSPQSAPTKSPSTPPGNSPNLNELAGLVTPGVFRPDGNLNAREIPIALQLPDWSHWLPHVHPKDTWGAAFTQSEFGALYGGLNFPESKNKFGTKKTLRSIVAAVQPTDRDLRPVAAAFAQWSKARQDFLRRTVKMETEWSPAFTDKVYSAQLWQLVKTWEMMQEFALEGRGRDFFGSTADSRTWCNTMPADTAPSATHIADGLAGVGGSALTNEYFSASWYELQILLNSGNHQHRDRGPVDWVYVVGRFRDLYAQTLEAEPTRLLVAVIKALQSTDPRLGPDDFKQGWRPDENVDPRIMISPAWAPIFKPLPTEVRKMLTASMLAAWMDKNLQYPVARYLPMSSLPASAYSTPSQYKDISGGNVWEAAQKFRDAGVAPELVGRLRRWGMAYNERAARLQYASPPPSSNR